MIYKFPYAPDWCQQSEILYGEIVCLKCKGIELFLIKLFLNFYIYE